ncbi:hypothetical protein BDF19DRAFT_248735 [Syncephalis fuscata]|nr:hypothetical protein BDF19DRAFT_248735 [Syncephalis fuscata]
MLFIGTRQGDPKRLIIVRFIIIILILFGLITIAIIQIKKAVNPIYIYQTSESIGAIHIPAFILYSPFSSLSNASIGIIGVYNHMGPVKHADDDLVIELERLTWGKDVIDGLESESVDFLNKYAPIWYFQPKDIWQYTPLGRPSDSNTASTKNYTEIFLTVAARPDSATSKSRGTKMELINIIFVEDPDAFRLARSNHKPVNIMTISNSLKAEARWREQLRINFLQYEIQSEKKAITRYDVQSTTSSIQPDAIHISISPKNQPANNGNYFVYETRHKKVNFSWLDCFGSIGGALTFSLALFAFLFGQRRVRPWGIIQRYIFRNRILGKFPRSVVEISSMSMSRNRATAGHDPVFNQDGAGYGSRVQLNNRRGDLETGNELNTTINNHSRQAAFKSLAADTAEKPITISHEALVQEFIQFKTLMSSLLEVKNDPDSEIVGSKFNGYNESRIDELEAFRQRVESFYLVDDLFIRREGHEQNKQFK